MDVFLSHPDLSCSSFLSLPRGPDSSINDGPSPFTVRESPFSWLINWFYRVIKHNLLNVYFYSIFSVHLLPPPPKEFSAETRFRVLEYSRSWKWPVPSLFYLELQYYMSLKYESYSVILHILQNGSVAIIWQYLWCAWADRKHSPSEEKKSHSTTTFVNSDLWPQHLRTNQVFRFEETQ